MTEEQWQSCDDPAQMWYVIPRPSRRVAALFAVACVRATQAAEGHTFLQAATDTVERVADDGMWDELRVLNDQAGQLCQLCHDAEAESPAHFWAIASHRLTTAETIDYYAFHVPFFMAKALAGTPDAVELGARYTALLRDVAGQPGRNGRGKLMKKPTKSHTFPVFRQSHLTPTVLALANGIYAQKAFDGMPVLADALQEAGCEDERILSHCRGPGPHARGCWVVDLLLNKE